MHETPIDATKDDSSGGDVRAVFRHVCRSVDPRCNGRMVGNGTIAALRLCRLTMAEKKALVVNAARPYERKVIAPFVLVGKEAVMPSSQFEVRVSLERLLIILIVVLVPLNFIGLYLAIESTRAAEQTTGVLFRSIAQDYALAARQFLDDRVIELAGITSDPTVLDAVVNSNRAAAHLSEQVKTAKIADVEKKWDTAEAEALSRDILASRASDVLRNRRELSPSLLKLVVLDENGIPVAATDKPRHYAPVNEVFWQGVSAKGRGAVYVSDVMYDEQSKSYYVSAGVPVLDPASKRFVGAVHAFVDVSPIFVSLSRHQFGRTTTSTLVREDGTVVSGSNVTPDMRLQSDEYGAVKDALGTMQGRQTGYVIASLRGGNRIVGFADTGLKQTFGNLPWLVIVSQRTREAVGAQLTVGYFALLMVVVALLMVTLLATYFFLHKKQEVTDIEAPSDSNHEPNHANSVLVG